MQETKEIILEIEKWAKSIADDRGTKIEFIYTPRNDKKSCEHKWKRIGYGHDKEYFECKKCGKQIWD